MSLKKEMRKFIETLGSICDLKFGIEHSVDEDELVYMPGVGMRETLPPGSPITHYVYVFEPKNGDILNYISNKHLCSKIRSNVLGEHDRISDRWDDVNCAFCRQMGFSNLGCDEGLRYLASEIYQCGCYHSIHAKDFRCSYAVGFGHGAPRGKPLNPNSTAVERLTYIRELRALGYTRNSLDDFIKRPWHYRDNPK